MFGDQRDVGCTTPRCIDFERTGVTEILTGIGKPVELPKQSGAETHEKKNQGLFVEKPLRTGGTGEEKKGPIAM